MSATSHPADIANPVQRAELLHLELSSPTRRWRWLQLLFLWTFIASLVLAGFLALTVRSGASSVPLGNDPRRTYYAVLSALSLVNVVLLVLTFVEYLLIIAQALMTASHAIVREKRGGTWDTLILTNMSMWQIVTGKWWGVLGALAHDHQRGIALRVGVIFWLGLTAGSNGIIHQTTDLVMVLAATLLMLIFMLLNMGMAASIGVLASSMIRRESWAFMLAGALHLIVVIATVMAGLVGVFNMPVYRGMNARIELFALIFATTSTPIDGGLVLALQLLTTRGTGELGPLALVMVSGIALYAALMAGALELARRVALHQGAAS